MDLTHLQVWSSQILQPQEDDEDSNGQHEDHDDSDNFNDNTNRLPERSIQKYEANILNAILFYS